MTYLSFLLYFVVLPALLLLGLAVCCSRNVLDPRHWAGTAILAAIAILWTTPWDNAIVQRGVWTYGSERVVGTLGVVPIEEYAFMLLLPVFNAIVLVLLGIGPQVGASAWRRHQRRARLWVALGSGLLLTIGIVLLFWEPGLYLGAILVWFVPPLALQGCFDPAALRRNARLISTGTLLPTAYFSLVDAYAIRDGIWTISEPTRTGIELFGLPVEEALFFGIVSLLVVQGLVLWHTLPVGGRQP